jgi:hypothetical protein
MKHHDRNGMHVKLMFILTGFFLFIKPGEAQPGFDHIDGQAIYFKDGSSVATNLCELNFIGQVTPGNNSRFLVVSGSLCSRTRKRVSIFFQRPVNDSLFISANSSVYSFPSDHFNTDGTLFSESRVFYGEVLPGRYGMIWFHKIYTEPGKWKYSILFAEIRNGKILESGENESISQTLEQVSDKKAFEIKGTSRANEP